MTGIRIVVGPPGAGKGLYLIQVVWDVLLRTDQVIVTNFAIDLAELNQWIQKNHPEKTINVHERVYMLPTEDLKKFYLIRGPGRRLQGVTKEQEKENQFADYGPCNQWPPVCYILDEADIMYGAREYADHGRSVNYYNKQHRKLGDAVWFCCQSVAQLDKQIRLLAQETIVLKNLGKIKYGPFRLPKVFSWGAYYQIPTRNDPPMVMGSFTLRSMAGLQDCFKTEAGVGMEGFGADKAEKQRGWSVWWLVLPAVLILFLVIKSTSFSRSITNRIYGKTLQPRTNSVALQARPLAAAQAVQEQMRQEVKGEAKREVIKEPEIWMTGTAVLNGRLRVYFSDGSVITGDDEELQFVGRNHCIYRGKTYRMRKTVVDEETRAVAFSAIDPVWRDSMETDGSTRRFVWKTD